MSVQLIAFVFGCLLLLVAIVGGGFQIKELTFPKVGRGSRVTSCAFSLLFVVLGVKPDLVVGKPAAAKPAAPVPQVVEVRVESVQVPPASVPTPAPRQVLPDTGVSRQSSSSPVERKQEAEPAAPRETKKRAWLQKTRDKWRSWKEARG